MEGLTPRHKIFMYLAGVFLTALLIGDTIGSKLFVVDIPLGFTTLKATLSVGAIWFPITFLLTDVVNEFYGAKGARFLTFLGFFMAILAFLVILASRHIPAASFSPIPHDMFNQVFGGANRIFVASITAYLVGQLIDIAVFQWAKRKTGGAFIWLRATGSTLISQLIDTVVVTYVAFLGVLKTEDLHGMVATSYVVKVMLAIGLTPVIYALHSLIHRRIGGAPSRA
jgi:queuosine precursor transporter